jgi:hypothetical protein
MSQKVVIISKQTYPNKDQLQAVLLGIGLFIRDLQLSCFTESEEMTGPGYIAESCMVAEDNDSITKVIESINELFVSPPRYVYLYNLIVQVLTN